MDSNNRWEKIARGYFSNPSNPYKLSSAERSLCELINISDVEFLPRIKKGFPEFYKIFFECKKKRGELWGCE